MAESNNNEGVNLNLPEPLTISLTTQNKKLDADQYSADDLDGATESLFGSGNMAYASLQAGQTDAAMANEETIETQSERLDPINRQPPTADTDRTIEQNPISDPAAIDNAGTLSNNAVSPLSAAELSSNFGELSFDTSPNNSSLSNNNVTKAQGNVSNSTANSDTNNVDNSDNSQVNNQNIDNSTNVDDTITNVTNIVNEFLEGEISLDLELDVLDTLTTDLNIVIDDSISGNLNIGAVTDNLTSITEGLTGINIPIAESLNSTVEFNLLSGEDVNDGNDIEIAGLSTPDIDLDIIEDIIGDIDITLDLPTDLLNVETLGETLHQTINNLDDINLASPEDIIDIIGDQNIDGAVEAILNQTELGESFDISGSDLLNDITDLLNDPSLIDTPLDLIDQTGLGESVDLNDQSLLDNLTDFITEVIETGEEAIAQSLQIIENLNDHIAQNHNDTADDAVDDIVQWTESTIGEEGIFDDIVNGIGGESDALPDPVGSVVEGVGILDVDSNAGGESELLGGLFG